MGQIDPHNSNKKNWEKVAIATQWWHYW